MNETTDTVLRDVFKQWLSELPVADRDALITEITTPTYTEGTTTP